MIRFSFLFHFSLLYRASMVVVFNYKIWKSWSIEIKFISIFFTWTSPFPDFCFYFYLFIFDYMYVWLAYEHEVILKTNQSTPITYNANLWPMDCWTISFWSHRSHVIDLSQSFVNLCRGRGTQVFIREGSAPRSNPFLFYMPFFTKKYPFRIHSIDKWYPFHIQSTPALRTPRYYGHPAITDSSKIPGESYRSLLK